MAQRLPRLRANLDFMESPVPDRPGLLIRDSLRYSDTTLIIPPLLVQCLRFFDGEETDLDLRKMLVEATGDLRVGEAVEHLIQSLSQAGFLEDEVYATLEEEKQRSSGQYAVRGERREGARASVLDSGHRPDPAFARATKTAPSRRPVTPAD